MRCEDLILRLYDEDVRELLRRHQAPPADCAEHVTSCPACACEWESATADLGLLAHAAAEPAPTPVRAALHGTVGKAMRRRADVSEILAWLGAGVSGAAAAAAVLALAGAAPVPTAAAGTVDLVRAAWPLVLTAGAAAGVTVRAILSSGLWRLRPG